MLNFELITYDNGEVHLHFTVVLFFIWFWLVFDFYLCAVSLFDIDFHFAL